VKAPAAAGRSELQQVLGTDGVELAGDELDGPRYPASLWFWLMAAPISQPAGTRSLSARACAAAPDVKGHGRRTRGGRDQRLA
jgi:hypothetical protein